MDHQDREGQDFVDKGCPQSAVLAGPEMEHDRHYEVADQTGSGHQAEWGPPQAHQHADRACCECQGEEPECPLRDTDTGIGLDDLVSTPEFANCGLPADQVTARAIAKESGANLSSINHHFGNKDTLITEAIVTGLDRWLEEISNRLSNIGPEHPWTRFLAAAEAVESTRRNHDRLATSFVAALARAPHDPAVRSVIKRGVSKTRPEIARLIDLGEDEVGSDAPAARTCRCSTVCSSRT